MKTPDEIKNGLECCTVDCDACGECPYPMEWGCSFKLMTDALSLIQQLEANWSQVSKALCGKENTTLDEVLQAIDQEKTSGYALPARSGKTFTARHGKWGLSSVEPRSMRFDEKIVCSVCRGTHPRFTGVWYKYCPNCGAEMDGIRNP